MGKQLRKRGKQLRNNFFTVRQSAAIRGTSGGTGGGTGGGEGSGETQKGRMQYTADATSAGKIHGSHRPSKRLADPSQARMMMRRRRWASESGQAFCGCKPFSQRQAMTLCVIMIGLSRCRCMASNLYTNNYDGGGGGDDDDAVGVSKFHSPLWLQALLTSADHYAACNHDWAQLLQLHGFKYIPNIWS